MPSHRLLAALAGLLTVAVSETAIAGAVDFEFQPVNAEIRNGPASRLAVRLIDKRTKEPVPGAIIFRTRLDMSPDDMGAMVARHEPVASSEPGVYRFRADITMAGDWAFKLQAKVQGETETVQSVVIFTARDQGSAP